MVSSSDDDMPLSKVKQRRNAERSAKKPPQHPPIKGPLSSPQANAKKKTPAKRKRVPAQKEELDSSENDGDAEDTPKKEPEKTKKVPARRKQATVAQDEVAAEIVPPLPKTKEKRQRTERGPAAGRTCPHCAKVISTKMGLRYHLDKMVCQKVVGPAKEIVEHTTPVGEDEEGIVQAQVTKRRKKAVRKSALVDSSDGNDLVTTDAAAKQKVAKRPRRTHAKNRSIETSDDDNEDSDIDDDDEDSNSDVDGGNSDDESRSVKKPEKKDRHRRGPEEERTCPHCSKVIVSKLGLKYHLDKFVCRRDLVPAKAGTTPRKRGKSTGGKSRERGLEHDRTCPNCNRVFTSVLGCNYHMQHQVCVKIGESKQEGPCDTLEAGSRFITQFGIVEVVKDDRATPAAVTLPPDTRARQKRFNSYKDRLEKQQKRMQASYAVQSRIRRIRFNALYAAKNGSAQQVHRVYFGGQRLPIPKVEDTMKGSKDPAFPDECFPDRIVECKLVPDERTKVLADEYSESGMEQKLVAGPLYSSKIFLRRRLLNKTYVADITVYACASCGAQYHSRDGFVYHVRSEVCTRKTQSRLENAAVFMKEIEDRVTRAIGTKKVLDKKKKRLQSIAVYAGVWESLGFKIRPYSKVTVELDNEDTEVLKAPEETLAALRQQLKQQHDIQLGAVYPSVWKSLGFDPPNKTLKRKKIQKERAEEKRRRRNEAADLEEVPAKPDLPALPIIDMQVLVDEADTGRYPSIQRFKGDNDEECKICKDQSGVMHKCAFCRHVVHLECARTKVSVKTPEPEDDFMCYSCINYILCRRRRAEKRRFQKQEAALDKAAGKRAAEAAAAEEKAKAAIALAEAKKAAEPKFESEYHRVAFMGQELSEMIELLADATGRLNQLAEASRANDIRRSLL